MDSAWTVWPIVCALYLTNIAANAAAVAAGQAPVYIATDELVFMGWCCLGGLGCTLPLNILMIRSRSKKISTIGKAAIASSIFNINEPVIFGMPIMLNPILAIPFIITPLVTGSIGYFATVTGFAGKAVVMVPWTTPPLINAWLSTAGSMGAVITQFICIVTAVIIYLPFVKIASRRAEQAALQQATDNA